VNFLLSRLAFLLDQPSILVIFWLHNRAMSDLFHAFDLNVRLEDDDYGNSFIDLNEPVLEYQNNGNVSFLVCSFSFI
jgi:hypothetical protein